MTSPTIRLIRPAPDPLGLYVRVARSQKELQNFIVAGAPAFTGVVFEARKIAKQTDLLSLVLEKKLDAVLDPQTQQMATLSGYTPSFDSLPWSQKRSHTKADFSSDFQRRKVAEDIAVFAVKHGFTQVLAPTHLLSKSDDEWLDIDVSTTNALRGALNRNGGKSIQINYSLGLSYEIFRTASKRALIIEKLKEIKADSIWLNIDGCGASSSPTAVTRYGDAATDFHSLGLPLIADHMGGIVGLSLLALGVIGGLSHGITLGERFSAASWHKPPSGNKPFAQSPRIYLQSIDLMLPRVDAEKLFESGGKARSAYGCRNTTCCSRGIVDMVQSPSRHFLYQRTQDVAGLSQIPESLRPQRFLEEHLRPASDFSLLYRQLPLSEELTKKLSNNSKRLNDLRLVLGAYSQKRRTVTFAQHPTTRVARGV